MRSRFAFVLTVAAAVLGIGLTGVYLVREYTKISNADSIPWNDFRIDIDRLNRFYPCKPAHPGC